jgi:hypothetical protein
MLHRTLEGMVAVFKQRFGNSCFGPFISNYYQHMCFAALGLNNGLRKLRDKGVALELLIMVAPKHHVLAQQHKVTQLHVAPPATCHLQQVLQEICITLH